jgi:outer membrane protein assembly factor BamB
MGKGDAASGKEVVRDAAVPLVRGGSSVAWAHDRLLYYARSGDSVGLSSYLRGATEPNIIPDAYGPATTFDGDTIVYASTKAGDKVGSLWSQDVDAKARTRLADHGTHPVVTHDGNVIFAVNAASGPNILWRVSIEGGKPPTQILIRSPPRFFGSSDVSRDGKLAFASRNDQDQAVVVVCDLPDCSSPAEYPIPGGPRIRWTPAKHGGGIAYVGPGPQPNIWVQPLVRGAQPVPFTKFTDDREIIDFAWSRDGEHLAITRVRKTTDIVLFKNLWRRP